MLEQSMLDAVKQYMASLQQRVTLALGQGEHAKRAELQQFLTQIVSTSDKLTLSEDANLGGGFRV